MMNNFLILSQQKQDDWRQNLEACLLRGAVAAYADQNISLLGEKAGSLKQFPFSVYKGSLLYKGSLFI